MLTNEQINDIYRLSNVILGNRNVCDNIQTMMHHLEYSGYTCELRIGVHTLTLSEKQKPIISILLQSALAEKQQEIDENNQKITEIAGSGADSSEENVQTFTGTISSGSSAIKLEETDEEEDFRHFIWPFS